MIKLFASDMDHTLLNDNSELPENMDHILEEIKKAGKYFVAASGRTLSNVENKFGKLANNISIVSDNGAILKHNGKIIHCETIIPEAVHETIDILRHCKDTTIVTISPKTAYIDSKNENHNQFLNEYYTDITFVDDLHKHCDDIIKITTLSPLYSHDNFVNIVDGKLHPSIYAVESGKVWIDIMNKGVNKGKALKVLLSILNITSEEIAVFGDYYNDIEMIQLAKYGYAVANAPEDVKKHAFEVIGSNQEQAVIKKIVSFL